MTAVGNSDEQETGTGEGGESSNIGGDGEGSNDSDCSSNDEVGCSGGGLESTLPEVWRAPKKRGPWKRRQALMLPPDAHVWSPVVAMCDHCGLMSARWHCKPCKCDYCYECFRILHRRGNQLAHSVARLPRYYSLHAQRLLLEAVEAEEKERVDEAAQAQLVSAVAQARAVVALRLQALYRGRHARRFFRECLRVHRVRSRRLAAIDRSDARIRRSVAYRVRQRLDAAPVLDTDTDKDVRINQRNFWLQPGVWNKLIHTQLSLFTRLGVRLPGSLSATHGSTTVRCTRNAAPVFREWLSLSRVRIHTTVYRRDMGVRIRYHPDHEPASHKLRECGRLDARERFAGDGYGSDEEQPAPLPAAAVASERWWRELIHYRTHGREEEWCCEFDLEEPYRGPTARRLVAYALPQGTPSQRMVEAMCVCRGWEWDNQWPPVHDARKGEDGGAGGSLAAGGGGEDEPLISPSPSPPRRKRPANAGRFHHTD